MNFHMSIGRRFLMGFLGILALFAANQAVYSVSARLRSNTMKTLDRTLSRQVALATLRQEVDNLNKQITVESQILDPSTQVSPESRAGVNDALARIRGRALEFKELSDPKDTKQAAEVEEFAEVSGRLTDAWRSFYQYRSADQGVAMASLITADPLAHRLLGELIPQMQADEKRRIVEAQLAFKNVEQLTDRAIIVIFIVSTLLLILGHRHMSRYITGGLNLLKEGAIMVGHGNLEHKIELKSGDELGTLADAFNEMSTNLLTAQSDLMHVNESLGIRNQEIEKQKEVSESLLLNILPAPVAAELQEKGSVQPKYFEDVTILFTDFVGFTLSTENLAADELVKLLHEYFTEFDQIAKRYELEKLKTIGDSYMCVGGLPTRTRSHAVDAVMAALEMVNYVVARDMKEGRSRWAVRIGMHTGAVVAGVVGIQKFAFDIWGENVNFASRMESSGAPNRLNISSACYARVKDFFDCEYRGKVMTKERKEADMYFVNGLHPSLADDSGLIPPPLFERRYRTYFEHEPPSFPAFLVTQVPATEAKDTA